MFFYEEDFCVFNREVLMGLPDQAVGAIADWDEQQSKKTTKSIKGGKPELKPQKAPAAAPIRRP